jgi:hypothetical protein
MSESHDLFLARRPGIGKIVFASAGGQAKESSCDRQPTGYYISVMTEITDNTKGSL